MTRLPDLHPAILALLDDLPPPDSVWPLADRLRWLRAMEAVFCHVYRCDGRIEIELDEATGDFAFKIIEAGAVRIGA